MYAIFGSTKFGVLAAMNLVSPMNNIVTSLKVFVTVLILSVFGCKSPTTTSQPVSFIPAEMIGKTAVPNPQS